MQAAAYSIKNLPLLMHAGPLSPIWPLGVLLFKGVNTASRRWLFTALTLSLLTDGINLVLALQRINNHWVSYLLTPCFGAVILVTLSFSHQSRASQYFIRAAALGLLLLVGVLTLTLEDLTTYSNYASPVRSLIVLAVSVWTILEIWQRIHHTQAWWRAEGLWIAMGFALYSAINASFFPLSAFLAKHDQAMMLSMSQVRSLLVAVSSVLISVGIMWQTSTPSGRSS